MEHNYAPAYSDDWGWWEVVWGGSGVAGAVWFARGFDTAIQALWLPWYPLPYMDTKVKEQKGLLGWAHEECGVSLFSESPDPRPTSKNTQLTLCVCVQQSQPKTAQIS